ncbi:hypothetical protein ACVWWG_005575 [Bradyrhizobium sp. LB7.2]
MMVSRVDMNILDSPASTILVTNSEGARYDIDGFLLLRKRDHALLRERLNVIGRAGCLPRTRAWNGFGSLGNRVTTTEPGRAAKQLSFLVAAASGCNHAAKPQSSLT